MILTACTLAMGIGDEFCVKNACFYSKIRILELS